MERAERRLPVPWWGVLVVALWAASVLAYEFVSDQHRPVSGLCMFRRVTGVPCPTCGTTRAVRLFASGDVAGAILSNPFMIAVGMASLIWLVIRLGFGRRLVVSDLAARWLWLASGGALIGNWLYLMVRRS